MSKRGAPEASASTASGAPPNKKLQTQFDSVKIGVVYSLVCHCYNNVEYLF